MNGLIVSALQQHTQNIESYTKEWLDYYNRYYVCVLMIQNTF